MSEPRDWPEATVYFREDQQLSPPGTQIQVSGRVAFEGPWLHIGLRDRSEIVTVRVDAVDRVVRRVPSDS
jgi:hypothetical protein